jgi:hypothetical protein
MILDVGGRKVVTCDYTGRPAMCGVRGDCMDGATHYLTWDYRIEGLLELTRGGGMWMSDASRRSVRMYEDAGLAPAAPYADIDVHGDKAVLAMNTRMFPIPGRTPLPERRGRLTHFGGPLPPDAWAVANDESRRLAASWAALPDTFVRL